MKRPAANRLFFGWVFVLVLVIMVVPFDLCDGSAVPEKNTYTVPTFRAQDLLQKRGGVGGTAAIRRELETILITTGLLAILVDDDTTDDTDTGIPTAATDPSTSGKDQPKTNRPYNPNKLQTARDLALEGLCHCWSTPPPTPSEDDVDEEKHDPPDTGDCFHLGRDSSASSSGGGGVDSALLSDGMTRRTTFATATLGHANPLSLPQPLPPPIRGEVEYDRSSSSSSSSMIPAMEILRDQVAYVSHLFVQALDDLSASPAAPNNPASRPVPHPEQENPRHVLLETVSGTQFRTWSSIVQASQNLEHFHLYERPAIPRNDTEGPYATHSTSNDPVTAAALEVHADAGLFLAFVPGRACDSSDRDDEEDHFYVQLPNPIRGEPPLLKRAVFPPGSIGIMLGAGAEHWVQRKRPSSHPTSDAWKATRHAVYMPPGHRRAWYGMSTLSSIIPKLFL